MSWREFVRRVSVDDGGMLGEWFGEECDVNMVDAKMFLYGGFVKDMLKEHGVSVDFRSDLDPNGGKYHRLEFYAEVEVKGEKYDVVLGSDDFRWGRNADDEDGFNRYTSGLLEHLTKRYQVLMER